MSGLTVHVAWTLDKSSVMLTGPDAERAVFFKREPLKGCKKTSGPRVGGECGKGGVTVGGARVSRFRLIYPFSFDISLVEGDIGICRQHTRVALPVTHKVIIANDNLKDDVISITEIDHDRASEFLCMVHT